MLKNFIFAVTLTTLAPAFLQAESSVILSEYGQARSVILLKKESAEKEVSAVRYHTTSELQAAQDLAATFKKIGGAEITIERIAASERTEKVTAIQAANQVPVLLGSLAVDALGTLSDTMQSALEDPSGFVLQVKDGVVAIAASSARGAEIGSYEMLEQLGMRWFFPGELGTVTPKLDTIAIPEQLTIQKPAVPSRYVTFNAGDSDALIADWHKHQREGGPLLPPAHGIKIGDDATPETHPKLFAQTKHPSANPQLCISNPEVLQRAIKTTKAFFKEHPEAPWIGMGPKDGGGFCECDNCRALDGGDISKFTNEPNVTDRYVWFFNQVLEGIKDEYPDKKIVFYAYHNYFDPPIKTKPNPKIVPAIAPIQLCRIHGLNNPVCPERNYLKSVIEGWSALVPDIYERGYWYNLADPGMVFVQLHRIREEIPYYIAHGAKGFRTECADRWGMQGPTLYIAGKLMWNPEADVDALLHDFCVTYFGPAAEPMERYFTFIDHRLRDTDNHSGSAFDILNFYPKDIRAEARSYLEQAAKLAIEAPYKERLRMFDVAYSYTENLAEMLEARNRYDWQSAYENLQKLDAITVEVRDTMQPPVRSKHMESYLRRFFRLPIEQGYARSHNGNVPIANLADTWETLMDYSDLGSDLSYESPGVQGGNWQMLPTYSTTWSNLGLRYYRGLAWYRQTVEIPKESIGKRVFLWMGGVDENARIWINGKLVGTSIPSSFTPFEVDVTSAIQEGKNLVAVCVANLRTDELGTGGITTPGFFYMPEAGAKATLENVKPLGETFP